MSNARLLIYAGVVLLVALLYLLRRAASTGSEIIGVIKPKPPEIDILNAFQVSDRAAANLRYLTARANALAEDATCVLGALELNSVMCLTTGAITSLRLAADLFADAAETQGDERAAVSVDGASV